jgi:hypothetical protein
MDERVQRYRKRATQLRKIADCASDEVTRTSLLLIVAEFQEMAAALELVKTEDRAKIKGPRSKPIG